MDRQKILDLLKSYKEDNSSKKGIIALGLFGSFAREQHTEESDVDIMIKTVDANPFIIVHIIEELEAELKLPLDIVRLREGMNPFLKRRIERDGIYV